jgi:solute:Na+ symporter, SSS family
VSPLLILGCVAVYFALLLGIAWVTSRRADSAGYFLGNKNSPWYVVAFGLIGDSLSGVTYISVPGQVGVAKFGYLQVVLGYVLGYVVICEVLLPLYYRLNLTSIYTYLGQRFGTSAQRTGSAFFLLSRLLGSAARLYLAANVFQTFVFDRLHIPFALSVAVIIGLMLVYTLRGGIKTLVWTDSFQSGFLVLGVLLSILAIGADLGLGPAGLWNAIKSSPLNQTFFFADWRAPEYFWKQFLSGAAIAVVMTGLDQNAMQKNLSCRSLRDAKKNLYAFSAVMVLVNAAFLALGALLFHYSTAKAIAIPAQTDQLFPLLALQHLGGFAALVFVIGLTAATFNSADSVLTTLTTSFCIDFLRFGERTDLDEATQTHRRRLIHLGFAVLLLAAILGFHARQNGTVIKLVLELAGYTYGPLLGLFALGLFTKVRAGGPRVPIVCVASPVLCWVLSENSAAWFGGYRFGFELLLLNGLFTAVGVALITRPGKPA